MKIVNNSFVIIGLFLILLQSSCTSQREIMDSWLNHSKQELVMSWGPPSRVYDNSPNGEVLIWAQQGYMPGFGGNPGITFWDYKYMYIDNNGKIYSWRTNRQPVPPQQIDLNIRRY